MKNLLGPALFTYLAFSALIAAMPTPGLDEFQLETRDHGDALDGRAVAEEGVLVEREPIFTKLWMKTIGMPGF